MTSLGAKERYVGNGHTLLRLVEGLVQMRAVDPNDNAGAAEVHDDVLTAVEEIESVEDLATAALQLIRLSIAMGMRPTVGEIPEDVITAEVGPGLELLESVSADTDRNLTVRMVATAMSVLFDYAFTLFMPVMAHMSNEEQEAAVRAAMLVAESSARSLGDEARASAGVDSLRGITQALTQLVEESKPDE